MNPQDNNSLAHATYNCKYHIVIVPKYMSAVMYNKLRADIIVIIKILIERKPGLSWNYRNGIKLFLSF